ncbi:MAG: hypothetical protein JWO58_959 [Chitinophagaceae bacterium]|nr:hypothetical protein [Chitinophagaceae bacterium]
MELHEKIDQYLLDQLSPADKAKFEELIAGDSHLKSELALQQSVVTALGSTRSVQLKSRLQKIPVSMSSTAQAIRLKWLGVAAAGSVAAGLIIFLLTGQEQTADNSSTLSSSPTTTEQSIAPAQQETQQAVAVDQTVKATPQQDVAKKEKVVTSASAKADLKAFDNSASFDETENSNLTTPGADGNTVPTNTLYTETNNKLSNLSVNVDNSNMKDKSYQFTGPKLTLFGDFNSKPYELLELNNKGQKTLFLSYDNSYYELVWGQAKKTPLKKVLHKETLEKLKVINP